MLSLEQHFQAPPEVFDPDLSRAWWKFKRLAQAVDVSYAARIGAVRRSWSATEERILQDQTRIEAASLIQLQTKP